MPLSKKRSCRDVSDSDDDSDDDLLTSVFGTSKSSKRRNAKEEEAKKKRRMEQMNALLDKGKIKLEQENRMDQLCKENNKLIHDERLDSEKNDESDNKGDSTEKDAKGNVSPSTRNQKLADVKSKNILEYQAKDANETLCLGSRRTLQFYREVSAPNKDISLSPQTNTTDTNNFAPFWFDLCEALTDLRTILVSDRQTRQQQHSFSSFREELLTLCNTNSPHACRTYLRKRLMCKREHKEEIQRLPVNLLRWLMAMACGSVINGYMEVDHGNNEKRTENSNRRQGRKEAESLITLIKSRKMLREAQVGAYETLYSLWSQDLGFPLQQKQNETYLLSISALPRQLRQWFGSTFPFEIGLKSSNITNSPIKQLVVPTTDKIDDDDNESIRVTSSHSTLIRFLRLWALGLQKQNTNDVMKNEVHLIEFHYEKDNREGFRNEVSNAIMAVLWVGLNHSFASGRSANDDGNKAIQTIVSHLLERVSHDDKYNDYSNDDVDCRQSFDDWLELLSERICMAWSKELGRGQKGTDAYEDEHAWLCLARTVTRLVCLNEDGYKKDGDSCLNLNDHRQEGKVMTLSLKAFHLSLCRCILNRAFDTGNNELNKELNPQKKTFDKDMKSCDWDSTYDNEEIRRMEVPIEIRSSQRWKAMTLAVLGLTKLANFFPEKEAAKCFAVVDICTASFQSAIVEIERQIQQSNLNEKEDAFDDLEDSQMISNNDTPSTARRIEDGVLEKDALYNALVRLEAFCEIIWNRARILIMQNICFPWASRMAESLRNYSRSKKIKYTPSSVMNSTFAPVKQQSIISTFFKKTDPTSKILTDET